MANSRKNLEELKENGTLDKNPGRYLARLAAIDGFEALGDPPAHLDAAESYAWNEIREKATPGTISEADFVLVEIAARLLAKSRTNWDDFSGADKRVLQAIANDLGMSPTTRGRVTPASAPKGTSKFAALAASLATPVKPN